MSNPHAKRVEQSSEVQIAECRVRGRAYNERPPARSIEVRGRIAGRAVHHSALPCAADLCQRSPSLPIHLRAIVPGVSASWS